MGVFALLCTLFQRRLPYHVNGVESNDTLYGGTVAYQTELLTLIDACATDAMAMLAEVIHSNNAVITAAASAANVALLAKQAQGKGAVDFLSQVSVVCGY